MSQETNLPAENGIVNDKIANYIKDNALDFSGITSERKEDLDKIQRPALRRVLIKIR